MADPIPGAIVTPDDLLEIIDSELPPESLQAFINMAAVLTSHLDFSACGGAEATYEIQKLIAAHFLTMYERTLKSENVGGEWSASYAIQDGEGLRSSLYGQMALVLDCTGKLAATGQKRTVIKTYGYYQARGLLDVLEWGDWDA